MHKLFTGAALAAAVAAGPAATSTYAASLEVEFTGLDIFFGFNDKLILQSGEESGDVDEIQAATFYVDGESIGTLVGDISAAVGIPGFLISPNGGTAVNQQGAGYFTLDFDTSIGGQGWLDLDVSQASTTLFYTGNEFGISFFGRSNLVKAQEPLTNRLPEWPGFTEFEEITFSYVSTNLSDVIINEEHDFVEQFRALGAGTIQGEVIPEPATASLLAVAGLAVLRRRR